MNRNAQEGDDPSMVFVALGSNLGDSPELLRAAMDRLDALAFKPVRRSSLWSSTPVDCPPGSPRFTNAVVGLIPRPEETPGSLFWRLQALETEFGRRPKQVLNEARPLDLDLIDWRGVILSTPELTLPHPRAHLRRFVLAPLAELVPGLVLPGQTLSVEGLLGSMAADPGLHRLPSTLWTP